MRRKTFVFYVIVLIFSLSSLHPVFAGTSGGAVKDDTAPLISSISTQVNVTSEQTYFRFIPTESRSYTITLTDNNSKDVIIVLYDSSGTQITDPLNVEGDLGLNGESETIVEDLIAGNQYFLGLNHYETGTYEETLTFDGAEGTLWSPTAPEIDVKGNSTSIADGDSSPSSSDHTDFGNAVVNREPVTRTFTIENTGTADLTLSGDPIVAISGDPDFTVSAQPTSGTVAASGSTTFDVTFTPIGLGVKTASISITNNDSDENPYNFSIQGTGVNTAPTLTTTSITLASTDEDTTSTVNVSTIVSDSSITDADGHPVGVAVTASTGNGTWQYSTDGSSWTDIGIVSELSSLLLSNTSQIRYIPDGANGETASISYRGWDGTSGTASTNGSPSTADTSANGGETAFSSDIGTASLMVTSVNDAPVLTPSTPTIATISASETENAGTLVSAIVGASITDVDTGASKGIAIIDANNVNGTWQYSTDAGSTWTDLGAVSGNNALLLGDTDKVRFVPNGEDGANPTITYRAWDQASGSAGSKTDASTYGGTTSFSTNTDTGTVVVNAVPLTISINDVSVNEGDGTATFTVTLDRTSIDAITLQYDTADGTAITSDSDYTGVSGGSVTIQAGSTTADIDITITDDANYEEDETFYVNLSNASKGTISDSQGVGTIINDDAQPTVSLSVDPANIAENGGVSTVTATLSAKSYQTVTVDLGFTGTASTEDYSKSNTSIAIAPGNLTSTITITGINDDVYEGNETVVLDITSVTNGTENGIQQQTVTITDDESQPTISIDDQSVTEGDSGTTNLVFTVALSNTSSHTITVDYATLDETATAGSDYTAITGTLTFNPGDTTKQITIAVSGDTTLEDDETFTVNLSNPDNATITDAQGRGTIIDDEPAIIDIADAEATEGDSGNTNISFTVTLSNARHGVVTVDYVTSDGTATAGNDYVETTGTLTFASGETSKIITVSVIGDTVLEGNETFIVILSNPIGAGVLGDAQATGLIKDDEKTVTLSPDQGLTEENLDGRTITATLIGETFIAVLDKNKFTLHNAPSGTVIDSVIRTDDTHAQIILSYDGTDFDTDISNVNITIASDQLTGGDALTSNDLTITATVETAPVVTTINPATSITSNSAVVEGNVTSDGGEAVTEKGIVYNTIGTPTTSDTKITSAAVTDSYTVSLTSLTPTTSYYVRAYAINSEGTSYGAEVTFTTDPASTNANLSSLSLSCGTLSPTFQADTTDYSAVVSYGVSSMTVIPTAADAKAAIKVNGISVVSGAESGSINLNVGENTITVIVTAEDPAVTKTYTVTITREEAPPADTMAPTPGNSGVMILDNVTTSGVDLHWTAATDNKTTGTDLKYKVVYSTSNNIDTVTNAVYNGITIQDWTANLTEEIVTGLDSDTTYYYNVIVKDEADNMAVYEPIYETTLKALDTTAPIVGAGGTITVGQVSKSSVVLNWIAATDNETAQENLMYMVIYSTENNIDTVSNAVYNGTVAQAGSSNLTEKTVTGLTSGTTYYFNILVADESGNKSAYTTIGQRTRSNSSNESDNNQDTDQTNNSTTEIIVNGQPENAGTATTTTQGSQTVTTISIDPEKLEQKLEEEGHNAVVTIPVNTGADIVIGELNGQMVKNMENQEAVLEVKTATATYTLPAEQINIEAISAQIGTNIALKDITVQIEIANSTEETVKFVEDVADKGSFTIVAPPMEFTIKGTYGGKTVEVSKFNAYVERMIAIPEGVDPEKITTGVVVEADGTVRHVPTEIIVIDGIYYAKINSLTNSTYSVVWNPLEFKDVENHWAKEAVNDMGSRMVVSGVGNELYDPNREITRAEFAAIIVRALGLKPGEGTNPFSDVKESAWYSNYIKTAVEYGLITGYSDGTFKPTENITREQAMTMIARAMNITGLKVEMTDGELEQLLENFSDTGQSAGYAKTSIAVSVKAGIVQGKQGNTIAPKDNITRAEVATMIRRLLQQSKLI